VPLLPCVQSLGAPAALGIKPSQPSPGSEAPCSSVSLHLCSPSSALGPAPLCNPSPGGHFSYPTGNSELGSPGAWHSSDSCPSSSCIYFPIPFSELFCLQSFKPALSVLITVWTLSFPVSMTTCMHDSPKHWVMTLPCSEPCGSHCPQDKN
jgi:hypothetical protein